MRRLQYSLRTLLILTLLAGCAMWWWSGRYARWAAQLADPNTREAAYAKLLEAQRYHGKPRYIESPKEGALIRNVVVSPQPYGPPCYVLFRSHTKDFDRNTNSRTGWVSAVDGNGYLLPWYMGANSLEAGSLFYQPEPDKPMHCVDTINGMEITELYALPITPAMKPALLLVYSNKGPKYWKWKADMKSNPVEIQLGPVGKDGQIEPVARFTWSTQEQRYIGPDGGLDQPFMRLTLDGTEWEQRNKYWKHPRTK